jgi:acetyl-CoA C-acetyltransferase
MVVITSSYITDFGEFYDKDLVDLAEDAVLGLNTDLENIDAVFVANMMGAKLYNMNQLGLVLRDRLKINVPFLNYSLACASGGLAFYRACKSIESGEFKNVLVVGVEKMTDFNSQEITEALMGASDFENEYLFGLTFTALYGLIASRYLYEHGYDSSVLDEISIKAHQFALENDKAQFSRDLTPKDFEKSPFISDPLKLLHCSPFTDGAAAIVLSAEGDGITVKDVEMSQDSLALKDRESITSFKSTRDAALNIYNRNNLSPSDIDVFEIHDCFSIAEGIIYEDLGLSSVGKGVLDAGSNKFNINLSGGLKACGHPVGATGVKQIAYLSDLLLRSDYNNALAQNMAGTGNTSILTYLTK